MGEEAEAMSGRCSTGPWIRLLEQRKDARGKTGAVGL